MIAPRRPAGGRGLCGLSIRPRAPSTPRANRPSAIVAALLAFSSAACGGVAPAASEWSSTVGPVEARVDLRFSRVHDLVEAHRPRSADELLQLLPAAFRSQYVVVYESRSVQGATYASPRVILHTPDAKFILTFNGDPSVSGYGSLETMEFDDAERSFRLREISFPGPVGGANGIVFSERDPPRCLACHGDDPRPIWDTYPTWPGVYGEHEHARPEAEEALGLASFLRHRAVSPRYSALIGAETQASSLLPGDVLAYEGKEGLSRNAEFGLELQILAYHRVVRLVVTSPRFERFRYGLLASLDPQCLDVEGFVPEAVRTRFSRSLADFEVETRLANAEQEVVKERRAHSRRGAPIGPPSQTEDLTPFRYLAEEGLGVSTAAWTLAFEKSTYDFKSPRRSTRHLERDLFDVVSRSDPTLALLHDSIDRRDGYCAALRRASLAALGSPGRPAGRTF